MSGLQYGIWQQENGSETFSVSGGGTISAGNTTVQSVDYAEYFEVALTEHTASGIPFGTTVALTGSKVIPASQSNSEPIGVTRPTGSSAFVAGAAHMGWHDRWLTDDFGEKLVDGNGNYQYNPEYSASLSGSYITREDRAEWVIVGLLGQIPMIKGQQTGSSWSKMRNISNTVEMWFVK